MTQMVKNPPANAGDTGDSGSIPEWERSSGFSPSAMSTSLLYIYVSISALHIDSSLPFF